MKFTINPKGVAKMHQAFDESWAEVVAALEVEMEETITDPNAFPELGFVDQDIVDTGRLRDSQKVNVKDRKVSFAWDPHSPENGYAYAPAVYSGFLAFGKKWIPGRRWPEKAVDRLDVPEVLRGKLVARKIKVKVKLKKKLYK